jgi:hypothetical protein
MTLEELLVAGVENRRTEEVTEIVYLEEGRQIGYLPSEVKDELGW